MNRSTYDDFRPLLTRVMALAIFTSITPQLNAAEVQVGRYSSLPAMPTVAQADLLATTITVSFPARIQTVGEAVNYLLQRSGYRMADAVAPETMQLLELPLPAVHRSLGPITLTQALQTLAGPAFLLIHDPVHRLISFELCRSARHVTYQTDSSINIEGPHDGE
jgi:type IV pili sensor histidine kinase/response regulator